PARYQDMITRLDAFVQEKIDSKQMVGVTVAFEHGDIFWSKGYGYADIENKVPATDASSYRMASVSKPFTAVGILELVEQGKVDLDAEIQAYLPDYPLKKWPLTSRHLLGHLGGVSHYRNYAEEAQTFKDMTTQEALAIFEDWELLAEPGTEYNYTTYGYNVLWAIIESVSGQSYQDFMVEHVWKPLGMENTTVDYLYKLIPNRVGAYRLMNGEIQNTIPVSTSLKIGGGGTRSTAGDMIRFASGLSSGKVLDEKTRKQMWQPMAMKNGRNITYGMGWGVGDLGGRYVVQHSGGQEGTRTHLVHFPGKDITVSAACNFEAASPQQVTRFIANMLLGLKNNNSSPYFSNDTDKQLYNALDHIYDQGLSYFDWNGMASSTKRADIDAAFALLNSSSLSGEAIDAAAHPVGGMKWQTLGSYMAQQISRINPQGVSNLYGAGQLALLTAYINAVKGRSDIPRAHYLSAGLAKKSWPAVSATGS
ncbi:MAG: serine hydrolase domain-containing protein, partial [Calditrichota bacterium]